MANKPEFIQVSELREIAAQTIVAEIGSHEVADSVRHLLDTMRREAAEYGLTDADVVRAVLRPIFRKTKGCDCYSCRARRREWGQDEGADHLPVQMNAS